MNAPMLPNAEPRVVESFGEEWTRFDQSRLTDEEYEAAFDSYFHIFPWRLLQSDATGFDLGCGSGRWAKGVARRVGKLHCIDASPAAVDVARGNLTGISNCEFHVASVSNIPLPDASMNFGYSLGVLHHVPDTAAGIRACAAKLKSGAPFLLYLYYAFDNRPGWYRALWKLSEAGRLTISRLPYVARHVITDVIAAVVYWPLARAAQLGHRARFDVSSFPLSAYRDRSFYTMRTDALDRFGTRLEKRFTREQIGDLMTAAGFSDVRFSEMPPFWCAVGIRR